MNIKSTDELIGEIRALSRREMSHKETEQMLDELRAHLDSSVQARLELGASETEATQEAIAAFGNPEEFVAKMAVQSGNSRRSLFDFRVLAAMLGLVLFLCVTEIGSVWSAYTFPPDALVGIALFLGGIFWTSWRAKRVQLLTCLAASLIAIPLFTISWSFGDIPDRDFGLSPGMTAFDVQQQLLGLHHRMVLSQHDQAVTEKLAEKYYWHPKAGAAPMRPYHPLGATSVLYTSPPPLGGKSVVESSPLTVERATSAKEAETLWKAELSLSTHEFAVRSQAMASDEADLTEKLNRPFWVNAIFHLSIGAMTAAIWGGVMFCVSFSSWLLRAIWSLRKKWRRRAAA